MSKTVTEHFQECKQVGQLIDDSNALLTKTRNMLIQTRETLEALTDQQHPMLRMSMPYRLRSGSNRESGDYAPKAVIQRQIEEINALLGDRA